MPTLAEKRCSTPPASIGSRAAAANRSPSASAWSVVTFSQITRNSSPPSRATVSLGLTASSSTCPNAASTVSPAAWPCSSFTDLKSSRST